MINLEGPRQPPKNGEPAKALAILLHGYGADGNDLIGLAPVLSSQLPHVEFISPHAPFPCEMSPFGRQWFSLGDRSADAMLGGARMAAQILDDFLNEQLEKSKLTPDRLALIGFSQGTMMSLYTAPRRDHPIAGILGYSGRIVGANLMAAETKSRPPVFLAHGEMDPVLPIECLDAAQQTLEECDFSVQTLRCPNLGHSIDENGLVQGTNFLRTIFGV